jgi:hypothetical protein
VADTGFVSVQLIRQAMTEDQHRMFHDAEWSSGCPICDKERASQ